MTGLLTTLAFVASIGVNTHIAYTDGGYANLNNIKDDLAYLKITHLRDGISNGQNGSAPLSSYIDIARAGNHFTIGPESSHAMDATSLQATLSLIDRLALAVPGSVTAVEGVNEINNFPFSYDGIDGLKGAIAMQKAIYRYVHADPALKGVEVDYFTGYDAGDYRVGPNPKDVAGLADYDNQHPYPNHGQPPGKWVNPKQTLPNEPDGIGPAVYTETGYGTNGGTSGSVNQDVQAKYELDLLCDAAHDGVTMTFLYELMDAYPPGSRQGDAGYGLFDAKNAPKKAATAIRNLVSILEAPAGSAQAIGEPDFKTPEKTSTLMLRKSKGVIDIIAWPEPEIWNDSTGQEITVKPEHKVLDFGSVYSKITIFDPLVSPQPIRVLQASNSATLSLTDHPVIIELKH